MSPCLVQQLFRQKVGQELDQILVDEILFPLLRQRKHGPRDLLLDIKMTQRWGKNGRSMITAPRPMNGWARSFAAIHREVHDLLLAGRYSVDKNRSPFTKIPPTLESVRAEQEVAKKELLGKVTSRFRRGMTPYRDWGTVDIMNELRELKHPVIECHPKPDYMRHLDLQWKHDDHFPDAYIRFEETGDVELQKIVVAVYDCWGSWSKFPLYSNDEMLSNKAKSIIKGDLQFVNHYLEHSLSNGGLDCETQGGVALRLRTY